MTTLTITRGLPASGKTTWAKSQQPSAVRVNRDDLRRMLHGGTLGVGWAEVQVTIAQRAQIEALLRAGINVICDDTNLRARVVRELADLAIQVGAQVEVRDFTDVPLAVCLERDAGRPAAEQVGRDVIEGMHSRFLAGKRAGFELPAATPMVAYSPPLDRPTAILVDLDGTVALIGDRSPYDGTRVHLDLPNPAVVEAVRALHAAGHAIVYCSGRTDDSRAGTEAWLDKHVGVPYAALHMRVTGDQRKDSVVKREIFDRELRDNWQIVAVLDDREQVVRMWRGLGLTVFQVAEGKF
jgi:predicted kinase